MGWTTPNTVAANDAISAANHNTYIRDNLLYLFSQRAIATVNYSHSADYTTTSTSFTAVDTTNLRLTATIRSGRALLSVSCEWFVTYTAGYKIYADILVDGTTRLGGTNGIIAWENKNSNSDRCSFLYPATGLSDGSHTFDLCWKVSAGTGSIYANAIPVTMFLIEV